MKITRLKRGYRLNLSDAEFALLSDFFHKAQCCFEGSEIEFDALPAPERRALRGRMGDRDALRIDDDRRGA